MFGFPASRYRMVLAGPAQSSLDYFMPHGPRQRLCKALCRQNCSASDQLPRSY